MIKDSKKNIQVNQEAEVDTGKMKITLAKTVVEVI